MNTANNIIIGSASSIKVAPYGVAEGDPSVLNIGFTDAGVKMSSATKYYDQMADQALGKVNKTIIERQFKVEIDLLESTMEMYQLAMALGTADLAAGVLSVGDQRTTNFYTIYINGAGISGATRKITLCKCVPEGNPELLYKKDKNNVFKLVFDLVEDFSQPINQEFYKIVETPNAGTPPTVILTTPAPGGTVTKATKNTIQATFNDTLDIDQSTLTLANCQVINTTSGKFGAVAGALSYNPTTKILTFTPTSNWTASDTLVWVFNTAIRDMGNNYLAAEYVGNFSVTA